MSSVTPDPGQAQAQAQSPTSTPGRRPHRHPTTRRLAAIVAIVALLLVAAAVDHRSSEPVPVATVRTNGMPVLPPATSLNASWYCPGAGAAGTGPAEGIIAILNPGESPIDATLTVVPSAGDAVQKQQPVAPRTTALIKLSDVVKAPVAAALVEMQGGVGAVEQVIAGPTGLDGTACATAASDHWYFATGTTEKDATFQLMLFNPFPGDAIVDLSFATDQGPATPGEFQGLVVPARGLTVVNVGEHVRRRLDIATSVTVRSGRVVAGRVQLQSSPPGATATLGAAAVAPQWTFPDGIAADGIRERYRIYNPGDREAQVEAAMVLDQGEAEPFELSVPARSALDLVTNDQTRIPKGVAHAAVISSTNGAGVVVERVTEAVKPSTRLGTATIFGSRMAAKRWLFPWGAATAAFDEWVTVFNPGTTPASVSVVALAGGQQIPVEGLQGVTVPPGRRVPVRLGDHIARIDLSLLVDASAPVVVERGLFVAGGTGMSSSMGIPAG